MDFDIKKCEDYQIEDGPLKIENLHILEGANYFSGGPVVIIRLNLGSFDEIFTSQIEGFYDKLSTMLPTLYEHHCSENKKGGFLFRVHEGTLLGHVLEHVAIELQTLAGMDVAYGKTRSTLVHGVYNVIFRFFDEVAGVYASKAALNLINAILQNIEFDVFEIIQNLILIREYRLFGPSTQAIVDEADKREIPWLRIDSYNLVQLGTGKYHKNIRATITSDTNFIAIETADNKYLTTLMLKDAGIPVLETIRPKNCEEVISFWKTIEKPITIKPCNGNLGQYIKHNLNAEVEITEAYQWVQEFDDDILVQPYAAGKNYRLLVIDYKLVAAVEITPPFIIGDGNSTIQQLIDELNKDPERQYGDKSKLTKVVVDQITEKILADKKLTVASVLPLDQFLFLKISGNPKLGGSSKDVTYEVHPFNKFLVERACKTIGLNIGGVDILASSIDNSILSNGGIVLEVNAAPDFRMHINPTIGQPKNVAAALITMLFPANTKSRIPVISITGTVGKTITANLINYCLSQEGYQTGLTNTEGLFIRNQRLMQGNMTFPAHVNLVLKDATIDCAILETSVEGILRRGLEYKKADIAIVLNVHEDHVGNDDIKYVEDLAYAKAVVAEEVYDAGYSILNADSALVLEMKKRINANIVLFSVQKQNKAILEHLAKGGFCVVIENNFIVIKHTLNTIQVVSIKEIPLMFGGKAHFMLENLLATVAALYVFGIPTENIKMHLISFDCNNQNLMGRLNFVAIKDLQLLLDYAHNEVSFEGLKDFLSQYEHYKIGVIDAPGDRPDDTIRTLGRIAAETYNEIIFYEGFDLRGRTTGDITALLKEGAIATGFDANKINTFTNPQQAWKTALDKGKANQLIVILSGRNELTMELLDSYKSDI